MFCLTLPEDMKSNFKGIYLFSVPILYCFYCITMFITNMTIIFCRYNHLLLSLPSVVFLRQASAQHRALFVLGKQLTHHNLFIGGGAVFCTCDSRTRNTQIPPMLIFTSVYIVYCLECILVCVPLHTCVRVHM